jgi:hypothetical protein
MNVITEEHTVHHIVQLMANIINYLSVSLYQGQFTHVHERSFAELNDLYDNLSKTPYKAPSIKDITCFYNNLIYLKNVTETDDPDYYLYMNELKKYIKSATNFNKPIDR